VIFFGAQTTDDDMPLKRRLETCLHNARVAEQKAAVATLEFRATWTAIARSWHALARELEYDSKSHSGSASALARNLGDLESPHFLKRL
jgi:hypothetical protein